MNQVKWAIDYKTTIAKLIDYRNLFSENENENQSDPTNITASEVHHLKIYCKFHALYLYLVIQLDILDL
jgi:isochorismate hydrolase